MRLKVLARVQLTVEIVLSQPWDESVHLTNLWPQAIEDAKQQLRQADHHFEVIGEPKVTVILVNKADR